MIRKEIKHVIEFEHKIDNLCLSEVESHLLKQDFYQYDLMHKFKQPLFQTAQQPQDNILSLIEDCDIGSYEQLQQIQNRINSLLSSDCHYDKTAQLKNIYLISRREIVESGITVGDVLRLKENQFYNEVKDPFYIFMQPYIEKQQSKKQFLWQFLDRMFDLFQKYPISQGKKSKKNELQQHCISDSIEKQQDMVDLIKRLSILVRPNYDKQIQKGMLNKQTEKNQSNNKKIKGL